MLRRGEHRGTPYATFGLAVDRPVVPRDWSGERETRFYDCVCFEALAGNVVASLRKGDRVIAIGHVELSATTTDAGTRATTRERLVVDAIGPELRWAVARVSRTRPARNRGTGSAVHE